MTNAEKKALLAEFAKFLDIKDDEIKVRREVVVETSEYEVGDIIDFTLTTGEEVSAIAMRQDEDGMLFVFKDCMRNELPMFEKPDKMGSMQINYYNSDLRHRLNKEILDTFPESIKSRMKVMRIGETDAFDKLRLLTKEEVFGENRLEAMKKTRNRVAFQGKDGDWEWYWLQDKIEDSSAHFARVNYTGRASSNAASDGNGVRPAFKI